MSEVKVRLSMVVPGATMLSSQDCEKMSKKEAYDHTEMVIESEVKVGKKVIRKKEILRVNTRKSKPARQNLSICEEGFYHMIGMCPSSGMTKVWPKMNMRERLEYHLNLIAENFGATSFSYEIFDN